MKAIIAAILVLALSNIACAIKNPLLDCLDQATALEMKCEDEHPTVRRSCEAVFLIRVHSCRAEARSERCR